MGGIQSLSNFDINTILGDRNYNLDTENISNDNIEHIKFYVDKIISSSIKEAISDIDLNNNQKINYKILYDDLLQKYQILTEKYHNLEFERNILNDTCNNLLLKKKND